MKTKIFAAILLGAGRSTRLGTPKGLYRCKGRPWLIWQAEAVAAAGVQHQYVVTGHSTAEYAEVLDGLPELWRVVNPDPDRGPFSSLQCGIRALLANVPSCRGAYILPIDTPAGCPQVWQSLAAEMNESQALCCRPWHEEIQRRGHPVLLAQPLLERIADMDLSTDSARLDVLLRSLSPHETRDVKVTDARVLLNLNTREDWAAYPDIVLEKPAVPLPVRSRLRSTAMCIREGRILTVIMRDPASGTRYQLPPGGKVEEGELPPAAAIRETFEETGYRLRIVSERPVTSRYLFPWNGVVTDCTTHFFLAEVVSAHTASPQGAEADYLEGVEWLPLAQAEQVFSVQKETMQALTTLTRQFERDG